MTTTGQDRPVSFRQMMENQNILHRISSLCQDADLDNDFGSIELKDFDGAFLIVGAESSGKTSVLSRIIGCEATPIASRICTRVPTEINLIFDPNLPVDQPKICSLKLPALKKVNNAEGDQFENLLPAKCVEMINNHFRGIKEEYKDEVHSAPIEVIIKGSYFPTMKVVDLPGMVSGSSDSNVDEKSKTISRSYLKPKGSLNSIILCESAAGEVSGVGGAMKLIAKTNNVTPSRTLLVLTKMDKAKDPDWEDVISETGDGKDGPWYRLTEMLTGVQGVCSPHNNLFVRKCSKDDMIVALYNKDTVSRKARHVKLLDQVNVEKTWLHNLEKELDEDYQKVARNVGLSALARKIDSLIIGHIMPRIEKAKMEAKETKFNLQEKLESLGIPPSEKKLKTKAQDKLKEKLCEKYNVVNSNSKELFQSLLSGDQSSYDDVDEMKNIVSEFVSECFDERTDDDEVLLCRFQDLKTEYKRSAASLVDTYLGTYLKEAAFQKSVLPVVKSVIRCYFPGKELPKDDFGLKADLFRMIATEEVIKPVLHKLHNHVLEQGTIWDHDLVEVHAQRRTALKAKLDAVDEIIDLFGKVISSTEKERASSIAGATMSPRKRGTDGEGETQDQNKQAKTA